MKFLKNPFVIAGTAALVGAALGIVLTNTGTIAKVPVVGTIGMSDATKAALGIKKGA